MTRRRSYVLFAGLTLTLAVGANLLVFTVVNALWLRPRPVADPDRVVVLSSTPVLSPDSMNDMVRMTDLESFRQLSLFEGVAGQVAPGGLMGDYRSRIVLDRVGHPVETVAVTSTYFSVLGVPVIGRDFASSDDALSAEPVAIISNQLWRTAFGADSAIIGTTAATSAGAVRIIGRAPPRFGGARLGEQIDLWIPRSLAPRTSAMAPIVATGALGSEFFDRFMPLIGFARLRPSITAADAERAIAAPKKYFVVRPLADVFGSPDRPTTMVQEREVLTILSVMSGLVLLAGCATLMALVLVHFERRRQELAVRLALGSTTAQLARRLTRELIGLFVVGTAGALVLTIAGLRMLPSLTLPGGIDLSRIDLGIDWRVALVAIGVAAMTLAAAAIVPIIRFSRADLATILISPASTGVPSSFRLRRFMLAMHVAASIVVLVAAGLFVRAVAYGFSRGTGFDVDGVVFVDVQPSTAEFTDPANLNAPTDAKQTAAYVRLLDDIRALPGVELAAQGSPPIIVNLTQGLLGAPSIVSAAGVDRSIALANWTVQPDYLAALGVPVVAGRPLTSADALPISPKPALITAGFAASLWPRLSALGQIVHVAPARSGNATPVAANAGVDYQIAGIVPDVVCGSLRFGPCPRLLTAAPPGLNTKGISIGLAIRARGDAAALVGPVQQIAASIFPKAARLDVRTGRQLVALDMGRQRLGVWFFSGFGLVVLTLGLGGVFGLVAYSAHAREREMGVRLAVGATSGDLVRRLVASALGPVVAGACVGLVISGLTARTARALLLGISSVDLGAYGGGAAILIVGAIAAALVAASRVRRLTPMAALRHE